jgi:hypothetical protein
MECGAWTRVGANLTAEAQRHGEAEIAERKNTKGADDANPRQKTKKNPDQQRRNHGTNQQN